MIIFETLRLQVRPFSDADLSVLTEFGVPEIASMMMALTVPWPLEEVRAWVKAAVYQGKPGFRAGVYLSDQLVGFVGIGGTPLTVAYAVHPDYQGQGIAQEALQGLVHWAFEVAHISEMEADHFVENRASGHILCKCGFEKYGEGMGESRARLEPAPIVLYRLTQQQFRALTKRAML